MTVVMAVVIAEVDGGDGAEIFENVKIGIVSFLLDFLFQFLTVNHSFFLYLKQRGFEKITIRLSFCGSNCNSSYQFKDI
jgi:hypothetical protein